MGRRIPGGSGSGGVRWAFLASPACLSSVRHVFKKPKDARYAKTLDYQGETRRPAASYAITYGEFSVVAQPQVGQLCKL